MCIRDRANNYQLIDYYSPMVDSQNGLKPEYAIDGVHPNDNGYEIMKKSALQVLEPVSYTHLDVYKRQVVMNGTSFWHWSQIH